MAAVVIPAAVAVAAGVADGSLQLRINDDRSRSRGRLRTMPCKKKFFLRSEKIRN